MAQLVVRNLPDQVKDKLQRQAKAHGRSLEARPIGVPRKTTTCLCKGPSHQHLSLFPDRLTDIFVGHLFTEQHLVVRLSGWNHREAVGE
jgi:hypothetical protein